MEVPRKCWSFTCVMAVHKLESFCAAWARLFSASCESLTKTKLVDSIGSVTLTAQRFSLQAADEAQSTSRSSGFTYWNGISGSRCRFKAWKTTIPEADGEGAVALRQSQAMYSQMIWTLTAPRASPRTGAQCVAVPCSMHLWPLSGPRSPPA